jgi:hypothetical protein
MPTRTYKLTASAGLRRAYVGNPAMGTDRPHISKRPQMGTDWTAPLG